MRRTQSKQRAIILTFCIFLLVENCKTKWVNQIVQNVKLGNMQPLKECRHVFTVSQGSILQLQVIHYATNVLLEDTTRKVAKKYVIPVYKVNMPQIVDKANVPYACKVDIKITQAQLVVSSVHTAILL